MTAPLVGPADSSSLADVLAQLLGALAGAASDVEFYHTEVTRYWQKRLAAGPGRDEVNRLRILLATEATDPALDRELRRCAARWANELAGRLCRR
jgi:hypothetical protein